MRTFILLNLLLLSTPSYAILTIDITGGTEKGGQPIAITPFFTQEDLSLSQNIAEIISDNLYRSGQFEIMPLNLLPETPTHVDKVNFKNWQNSGIPYLVIGRIGKNFNDYTVEFELVDIALNTKIMGFRYRATQKTLRQVAHKISDKIYESLTGERSIFNTRIVYVTSKNKQHKLYIADADGNNPQLMLKSKEPILSPSWSPDGKHIAYVTYSKVEKSKRMSIYIQEIQTGYRTRIAAYKGINAAPAWSPDGRSLALTLSKDGNPEIYLLSLHNKNLTRLTHNHVIDTEPEWHPSGKYLVFTSDRSGNPQIYRMSPIGNGIRRLTFSGNYNARPRFSPDGKKLALLHSRGKGYRIAVLNLATGKLNVLTKTTLDESPSFAPNGNMIIYATTSALVATSIDGRVQQRIAVDMGKGIREPAWSPFFE
ncbi:Tol-Pal system beta propeller repeat protein TolB [Candidatus Halobeggiatoa sp. HSG11]|nr:Tol-Pal system beta propeller repeat protein TolB [Candidatus Halobeggiatoa sp. HSG11]